MKKTPPGEPISRRSFLRSSAAVATTVAAASHGFNAIAAPATYSAVDLVPFGKNGLQICRLGIGTGTDSGRVQRELGQDQFTRLIRYAYDQGVTYIDAADSYKTHEMIREAIKGLPRETLFIQTKMPWSNPENVSNPRETIDRYRRELGIDYIDSLLIHCTTTGDWPGKLQSMMDGFSQAEDEGIIRTKGVSCHGIQPLVQATRLDWVETHLVRVNPQGRWVDSNEGPWAAEGNVDAVMPEIRQMHAAGRGVIGMKIIGNGDFTNPQEREKSFRFAMSCGSIDSIVVGFKNIAEVDEAIERMNAALRETRAA
jgi:predicted aldo/keto reductase-like oxidoreductase